MGRLDFMAMKWLQLSFAAYSFFNVLSAGKDKKYYRFKVDEPNKFSQIYLSDKNQLAECQSWIESDEQWNKGVVKRRCTEGDCFSEHVRFVGKKRKSKSGAKCLKFKDLSRKNFNSLHESVKDMVNAKKEIMNKQSACRSTAANKEPGCFIGSKTNQRWESCVTDKFTRCDETDGLYSDKRLGKNLCYGGRYMDGKKIDLYGSTYVGTEHTLEEGSCQIWQPNTLVLSCKNLVENRAMNQDP